MPDLKVEEEIEQLKSVLRSLVVSSPTQVDVRSLLRDYRNMIGSPVPLRKYGHSNPVEFLKERFSDCFLFSGLSSNPVLTLIVPDTLRHIDKFVQKQKSSTASKFNPKRRSVPEELVNPPKDNLICKTFHKTKPLKEVEEPTKARSKSERTVHPTKSCGTVNKSEPIPTATKSYLTMNKLNVVSNSSNGTVESSFVSSPCLSKRTQNREAHIISEDKVNRTVDNEPELTHTHIDSRKAVKNFLKKRLPLYNSSQDLEEEDDKTTNRNLQDDDSGRHTSSSGQSAKALKLEQLKEDILKLITDAPDGVWCTDLIKLYKERFGQELNFSRFGYTSILSVVYSVEQRVHISRPDATGDWLLRPRAAAPAPAPRRPRPPPARRADPDPDDALPGIDYDPDVFPEDCMHFMESIEPMDMSAFRPGAMVEVIIGEVYSPSHFWFIRSGHNYNIAMDDMMDEMTRYYGAGGAGAARGLARGAVRVGHYCSSVYERDWHRSLIVKLVDADTVKVRHVDYGTVDTVSVSALRPLRREWATLPAQAVRARLAAVRPPAAGWRWPHAAAAAFLALVEQRRLVANVVALDARAAVAEVLLIDTSGARDRCLSADLVRLGHADARADSALASADVYLYPRFEALESGATPNYAEVHAYLRDGIALDYVAAYRDHVPRPPRSSPTPRAEVHPQEPEQAEQESVVSKPAKLESPQPKFAEVESAEDEFSEFRPADSRPAESNAAVSNPAATILEESKPEEVKLSEGKCEATASPAHDGGPGAGSSLCPLAPAYVPGPSSPPPPYGCSAAPNGGGGVTLSPAEVGTYRMLALVNPEAAHWFMVGAMGRAAPASPPHARPPPPPHFAPPRFAPPHFAPPHFAPPHFAPQPFAPPPPHMYPVGPTHMHPPLRMRPPPGFGKY